MTPSTRLAGQPASAGLARRFVAGSLHDAAVESSVIEMAVLLVSELVTNVVVHTKSDMRVLVHADAHWVRVEVEDSVSGELDAVLPPDGTGTFGLTLVDRLSTDWGSDARPGGKVVWFEIAR